MKSKSIGLALKLSFLLLATTASASPIEDISAAIQKCFAWPLDALSGTDPPSSRRGPLLSQKIYRSLYDSDFKEQPEDALFSFTVTGSAARRAKERELNGMGSNFYDGPYPWDYVPSTHAASGHDEHDAHDAAHEMVVHVTYEDICEFCC